MDGRKAAEVARAIGMKPQTLDAYLRGAIPSADRALLIADALAVNVRWLITGRGPRESAESPRADDDWRELPRYDLFRFGEEGRPEPEEMVRIRRDWISRLARAAADPWLAEMPSDAMPDIGREGDLVLCEDVRPPLVDGRVYVFLVDSRPIVRRLQARPEGLLLKASAPDVDPIMVRAEDVESLVPVGRVLGSISLQAV